LVLVYVLYYTFYSTKMSGTNHNKKNVLHVKNNTINSKQKVLLPTLREQQRYVVYTILTEKAGKPIGDFATAHNNILQQCNAFLGIFDGGKAGLIGVKYNAAKMRGIIRVNNKYVDKLKVCLGLIIAIDGSNIIVDCIFVSGMLNKAVDRMNS
jgi:RNase P/RNase MRP subunit POP5